MNLKWFQKGHFIGLLTLALVDTGCATNGHGIVIGMGVGGGVGALVGTQIGDPEDQVRNTIISALIFAAISAGAMALHYRAMEQQLVEISGRYSRFRLCNPDESGPLFNFNGKEENGVMIYQMSKDQISEFSLSLDSTTKWVYPTFRKRYLMPDVGSSQMLSKRFVWEIVKDGYFVTPSQNPEYFLIPDAKKVK